MQLGFVSAILADLELPEIFEFASANDFDCVEVMCWPRGKAERRYAGVTHIDLASLDEDAVRRIEELQAQTGVRISALGYYPNPLSADAEERRVAEEHIRRMIDAAVTLGLSTVNTFVGRNQHQSIDDNWTAFMEIWPALIAHAEARGIRVGIENCPMLFTQDEWPGGKNLAVSPAIWSRMFADIPSESFGLNYDPSHLVWQQMDEVEPIRRFAQKLFHVHAKDVRIDRKRLDDVGILAAPLAYHTPKLPGLGEVWWDAFFAALTDVGYDGPVCVEVEDRAYEGDLAGRKRALRQSAAYLRQFMGR